MFIKLCILKSDIKSVAFGTAEKHSVNTLERASQWGWLGTRQFRGMDKNLTPSQELQDGGKSNSSRTNLFHPLCLISGGGIQTANRSVLRWKRKEKKVWGRRFLLVGELLCLQAHEYITILELQICQWEVKVQPRLRLPTSEIKHPSRDLCTQ